jgi:hypothetical protein
MLYIAAHAGRNYRFSKTEILLEIYFKLTSKQTLIVAVSLKYPTAWVAVNFYCFS